MPEKSSFLTTPIPRRAFLKGLAGFTILSGAGFAKGYSNTFSDKIRLENIPIQIRNLPQGFKNLKILQLSDLHSSSIVDPEHIARSVEIGMSQKPDLIVLTGDYIGEKPQYHLDEVHPFDPSYLEKCVDALSYLKAPLGVYGVLGNHDFWAGPVATDAIVSRFEKKLGVVWLRNSNVTFDVKGQKLSLLGVDDYWERTCLLGNALKGLKTEGPNILLSHNPEINEIILPQQGIDLVLSGHTHGGQVVFPVIGAPFYPGLHGQKYREGLVRDGLRQTYINRGVGHLVAPIRFNCPPEVTVINLV